MCFYNKNNLIVSWVKVQNAKESIYTYSQQIHFCTKYCKDTYIFQQLDRYIDRHTTKQSASQATSNLD